MVAFPEISKMQPVMVTLEVPVFVNTTLQMLVAAVQSTAAATTWGVIAIVPVVVMIVVAVIVVELSTVLVSVTVSKVV